MVCLSCVWKPSVFAARLRKRVWPYRLAGFSVPHYSTKTAPHIPGMDYQDAVCTLNTLQTNASALEQVRRDRSQPELQLQAMRGFLERAGLTVKELDHLNIIHVTGTKGKGSTCAFTEHILRGYGFRTGFYSSPHLVQVRERIRINGQPIGKDLFTKYFWQVYGRLDETKEAHDGTMPAYFRFLTILAFHVFLQEKVDLAVIEVGIGGAYDCTNIIRRPWVCGISSLGIDHTQILGDTIEKIAWQKGGIFKPGVPAFIVKQPEEAMEVLRERAREISCPLWVCPDFEDYQANCGPLKLGLAGQHQRSNASLALQLSHTWLQRRCQPETTTSGNADQQNFNVSVEHMLTRCLENERSWRLHESAGKASGTPLLIEDSLPLVPEEKETTLVFPCILSALQWITQGRDAALSDPSKNAMPLKASVMAKAAPLCDAAEIHVLITGSLHLVGGALKHLVPESSKYI